MLFIYRVLPMGGIETFFVRMAKERHRKNLKTSILLLSDPKESNQELLNEMRKYATVLFYYDLFYRIPVVSKYFPLLAPMNKKRVVQLFNEVNQIHAFVGMHALLGQRLSSIANVVVPITIGFYHYIVYIWGGQNVAHHDKVSRKFVFNFLPKEALLFFSEGNRDFHSKHKQLDFSPSQVFRLGVVDKKPINISGELTAILKVVAVGRLVEFKTYNLYMLDVIHQLKSQGVFVQFDIYGEGPLRGEMQVRIKELDLQDAVFLKGNLDYSLFDDTLSNYDLFVGSGTAIIQAASLGIPSIVGVENMLEPKTYGYFSDVHTCEYNLKGLNLPLISVQELIEEYVRLSEAERLALKNEHLLSIENFTNKSCQDAIESLKNIQMPSKNFPFNAWAYETSRAVDQVFRILNSQHPYNLRHEELKILDKP